PWFRASFAVPVGRAGHPACDSFVHERRGAARHPATAALPRVGTGHWPMAGYTARTRLAHRFRRLVSCTTGAHAGSYRPGCPRAHYRETPAHTGTDCCENTAGHGRRHGAGRRRLRHETAGAALGCAVDGCTAGRELRRTGVTDRSIDRARRRVVGP